MFLTERTSNVQFQQACNNRTTENTKLLQCLWVWKFSYCINSDWIKHETENFIIDESFLCFVDLSFLIFENMFRLLWFMLFGFLASLVSLSRAKTTQAANLLPNLLKMLTEVWDFKMKKCLKVYKLIPFFGFHWMQLFWKEGRVVSMIRIRCFQMKTTIQRG